MPEYVWEWVDYSHADDPYFLLLCQHNILLIYHTWHSLDIRSAVFLKNIIMN